MRYFRKYLGLALLAFSVLTGLAGCGTPTNVAGNTANSSAVSSAAMSGYQKEGSCANDRYRYKMGDGRDLLQYTLDGKKTGYKATLGKEVIEEEWELVWVTDEWIYYLLDVNSTQLWRLPVKRTSEGEKILPEESRKLFSVKEGGEIWDDDIFITDDAVFYALMDYKKDECIWCRYDIADGKSVTLNHARYEEIEICWLMSRTPLVDEDNYWDSKPIMLGNKLFFQADDKLCALDVSDSRIEEIYSGLRVEAEEAGWTPFLAETDLVRGEDCVFFTPDKKRLFRYDGKKTECILKHDVLHDKMFELGLPTGGSISIDRVLFYEGSLYLYTVLYTDSESIQYGMKYQTLLSAPAKEPANLQEEEKVQRYLDDWYLEYDPDNLYSGKFLSQGPLEVGELWNGKIILYGRIYVTTQSVPGMQFIEALYNPRTKTIEKYVRDKKEIRRRYKNLK